MSCVGPGPDSHPEAPWRSPSTSASRRRRIAPSLPTADLEQLARDIRDYHDDADSLNVRVVDSERAVTFDRHLDGGELLQLHLVATVRRNERFGVDSIEIRGVPVDL